MKEFLIAERYRMEIRWKNVIYNQEGIAELQGCYLCGPVITDISIIQPNDAIYLDFIKQYPIIINNYYIAKFSWGEINITPYKIFLKKTLLCNKNINVVPKLKHTDYIVVDTAEHEAVTHHNFLNYKSYLLNGDNTFYNFRK